MGGHVKYGGGQGKLAKAAAAASSGNQSVSAIGQVRAYIIDIVAGWTKQLDFVL